MLFVNDKFGQDTFRYCYTVSSYPIRQTIQFLKVLGIPLIILLRNLVISMELKLNFNELYSISFQRN